MRTLRFIGMAIVAVIMSVNFAAYVVMMTKKKVHLLQRTL